MKTKQIVFTERNTAKLLDKELACLSENEVMIETAVSTISAGTERANIIGDPNVSIASTSCEFPRTAGYSSSGRVIAIGSAVTTVKVGDRVAVGWGKHQGINIVSEENVTRLPSSVSFRAGAIAFIATFSMAAIRKTRLEMGESALVMGLGILGLAAVKLLRVAGAVPIIAADPNPARRETALKNGADYALDPLAPDFSERVKEITSGGVNVAIEVSGVGAGFNEALDCMARFGRVALLGCTRNSDFKVDYYRKIHGPGITVIGAHTMARPSEDSHPGWFTSRADMKAIVDLCAGGRLALDDIVEETHAPNECEEVFGRLVFDKDFPIVVQFDWSCGGV